MPEISEICEFFSKPDGFKYTVVPGANGDIIIISGANISATSSATLSWLINTPGDLKIEIKKKES